MQQQQEDFVGVESAGTLDGMGASGEIMRAAMRVIDFIFARIIACSQESQRISWSPIVPRYLLLIGILAAFLPIGCRENASESPADAQSGSSTARIVEAGCGSCVFDMPGVSGCPLAVRIDGKAYLVEGSDIDDHGDAHAEDGLCNAIRQAEVVGTLDSGRFVATSFRLLTATR